MNGYQDFFKERRKLANKAKIAKNAFSSKKLKGPRFKGVEIFLSVLSAGLLGYLWVTEDLSSKLLNKIEINFFGPARASESSAKSADAKRIEEKKSPDVSPDISEVKSTKRAWTDEEITLFTKLEERKKQLDAREAALNKLDEELQKQKEDLEKRLAALEDVRAKIATKLEGKVKSDGDKVNLLVSVYSNMKPAQAATIIQGLNEDLAVEVLAKMKNKNAAEILNMMDPEKAKHLSERFAGFKAAANN